MLFRSGKNQVSYILTQVMSRLVEPLMRKALERQSAEDGRGMCRRIMSMHQVIFEAVRAGDADGAARAMTEHIETFGGDLKGYEATAQGQSV